MSIRRPRLLSSRKLREEEYFIVRGRGGCYACSKLRGTMLNTYTNQIVAICENQMIQHAPHPRDGCHLLKPYNTVLSELKPRVRRKREQ